MVSVYGFCLFVCIVYTLHCFFPQHYYSANVQISDSQQLVTQPLLKIATISSSTSAFQQPQMQHGSNGNNMLRTAGNNDTIQQRRASRPAVLDVQVVAATVATVGNSECPPPLPAKERRADNHYIKNKSMQSPTAGKNRVSYGCVGCDFMEGIE